MARWVLAGLLIATMTAGAGTSWAAQVDPLPFERDASRLKVRIDERWRVIPLQSGLLLVPKRPSSIKGVELTRDGAIAIDGQTVTGADVQNRLGPDADAVLRLSYLSPSERAALFEAKPPADTEPVERTKPAPAPSKTPNASNAPWTEVMPVARGDRFRLGGNASVDESEQVKSVTAIWGNAIVDGIVAHDVIAVGGDVRLGPKAIVRGAVTSIGGKVNADPNARVDGQVSELGFDHANLVWWPDGINNTSFNVGITPDWRRIARVAFIGSLVMSVIWIALCASALVLAPNAVNRSRQTMASSPIVSFITGLATQALFGPLMALIVTVLAVSIIGIPLIALVPVATFALFVGTIFGSTAILLSIGERMVGRAVPLLALIAGGALLGAATLAGRYFWMVNGGAFGWGFALAVLGIFIEYVAVTLAIGGAVLSAARNLKWRRKRAIAAEEPLPVLPIE